jgi:hypothetical protein
VNTVERKTVGPLSSCARSNSSYSRPRLLIVLFVILSGTASAQSWPQPKWGALEKTQCWASDKGKHFSFRVGNYRVRFVPEAGNSNDPVCRAYLIDDKGKTMLVFEGWIVSIYQGTGEDLFGDGYPSLVLQDNSGGAHCCYTYQIVSLAKPPVILKPIENETAFYFFKDKASGQYRIMTSDGAFDYFDGLCHACTPFPRVVLKVDHDGLHDVSPQFIEQYDSEIAFARAKIPEGEEGKFVESDFNDGRTTALEIVFSYLYSGRETLAWQTLDRMWPANDRARIKKLILDTRAKGFLSQLRKTIPAPAPSSASTR